MRARKRNPWWGQGLDKRQARRVRRRTERRVVRIEAFMDRYAPEFKLMPWQRDLLRTAQATDLTYHYDPQPMSTLYPQPGVTSGHLVVWGGEPGPAQIAKAAMLTDDEGIVSVEVLSDFEAAQVVDVTRKGES